MSASMLLGYHSAAPFSSRLAALFAEKLAFRTLAPTPSSSRLAALFAEKLAFP